MRHRSVTGFCGNSCWGYNDSSDGILWGDVFETGVSMGRYIVEVIAD